MKFNKLGAELTAKTLSHVIVAFYVKSLVVTEDFFHQKLRFSSSTLRGENRGKIEYNYSLCELSVYKNITFIPTLPFSAVSARSLTYISIRTHISRLSTSHFRSCNAIQNIPVEGRDRRVFLVII